MKSHQLYLNGTKICWRRQSPRRWMLLQPGGQKSKCDNQPAIGLFLHICSLEGLCIGWGWLWWQKGYGLSPSCWIFKKIAILWQRWYCQGEHAALQCSLLWWCCWWCHPYYFCHWSWSAVCIFWAWLVYWLLLRIHVAFSISDHRLFLL